MVLIIFMIGNSEVQFFPLRITIIQQKSNFQCTPIIESRSRNIIINQFLARASLPGQIVQELRDENLPVLETMLSSSVKIKESHQFSLPMIHLDARHKLTLEFSSLYDEIQKNQKSRRKSAGLKKA